MNLAKMKKSETTEQIELFNWAKRIESILPELALMYHVPNEGKRNNGDILKAMGMKKGVPDVVLPVPSKEYHGLYLEMKFDKNKPTQEQQAYMKLLRQQGYKTAVCYSHTEAKETILDYLSKPGQLPLKVCVNAPWINNKCDGIPLPSGMFARAECGKCEKYNLRKEERILKSNLANTNREFSESILKTIFYLSAGNPIDGCTLEETLETVNKNLALLVKSKELNVEQSAAVLEVAIKAYECGCKERRK